MGMIVDKVPANSNIQIRVSNFILFYFLFLFSHEKGTSTRPIDRWRGASVQA
jgi:hypothetical protein